VSAGWATILVLAAVTAAIRVSGPVVLGGRDLPRRLMAAIGLLAPALLAALVLTETFADGSTLEVDERALGVASAAVTLAARGSMLLAVAVAGGVTALARALL
jgi:branched-subunit amino acid transport protein